MSMACDIAHCEGGAAETAGVVAVLRARAEAHPDRRAFVYVDARESIVEITFGQLFGRACRILILSVTTQVGVWAPRRFTRKQDIWDSQHIFDRVCDEQGIEHRLTKPNHPWTTDEVEQPCLVGRVLYAAASLRRTGAHSGSGRDRRLACRDPRSARSG